MSPARSCWYFIYSLSFAQRERERKSSFYSFTKGLLSLPISGDIYTYTVGKAQLLAHCRAEVVPRGTWPGATSAAEGETQGVQPPAKGKETDFGSKIKGKAEIRSWPCCVPFASGATAQCQSRGSGLVSAFRRAPWRVGIACAKHIKCERSCLIDGLASWLPFENVFKHMHMPR